MNFAVGCDIICITVTYERRCRKRRTKTEPFPADGGSFLLQNIPEQSKKTLCSEESGGKDMDKKLDALFTPWKIGNCEIKNRFVLTSMGGTDLFGWME